MAHHSRIGVGGLNPDGSIVLRVYAKPRARFESLTQNADGTLTARVTAPPVDGQANAAIVALIARRLRLPRRAVRVSAGARGRIKRVELTMHDAAVTRVAIRGLEPT